MSDKFIDELCALMQRAHFRLFSQREWQFAQSENFMFTLPVNVAWESLDSSMISRLFVRHPHLGLQAAQLARRVLVFHRGSTVIEKTGAMRNGWVDGWVRKQARCGSVLGCAGERTGASCSPGGRVAARACVRTSMLTRGGIFVGG